MPKTQIDFLFGKGRMKATNALQISFLKNDSAFKVKSNKTENYRLITTKGSFQHRNADDLSSLNCYYTDTSAFSSVRT